MTALACEPIIGLVVAGEHILIAHGRDHNDVSLISGVLPGGGEHTVSVAVGVDAEPSPTLECVLDSLSLDDLRPEPSVLIQNARGRQGVS